MTKDGWASDLSGCCPEAAGPTAGVGTIVRLPGNTTETIPRTELYKQALATGRTRITMCNVHGSCACYVVNPYGWTNGADCDSAASHTDALMHATI